MSPRRTLNVKLNPRYEFSSMKEREILNSRCPNGLPNLIVSACDTRVAKDRSLSSVFN